MFSNLVMKILEGRPASYDRRMNRLSRGRVRRMKSRVVAAVPAGSRVLEMGCGTGELAELLSSHGCTVEGFDPSPAMLELARQRIAAQGLQDRISVREMGVEGMDGLAAGSYDAVVGTLVLSELTDDERRFALVQALRVLKPGGLMVIADEMVPRPLGRRILRRLAQAPLGALSYLVARVAIRPLAHPAAELESAGLELIEQERDGGDSFGLLVAQKPKDSSP